MPTTLNYWTLPLRAMRLLHMTETPTGILVGLETEPSSQSCPYCLSKSTVGYGKMNLRIRDLPIKLKAVMLDIKRCRLRCTHCRATFNEPIAHISECHRATTRLTQSIWKGVLSQPFSQLANNLGLDPKTVRNIFNSTYRRVRQPFQNRIYPQAGFDLAIYPLTILRQPRLLWINCNQNCLADISADDTPGTIAQGLQRFAQHATLYLPSAYVLPQGAIGIQPVAQSYTLSDVNEAYPATAQALERLAKLMLTRFSKRSFEVFCATALLDKSLHKTLRTGIDPQGSHLRYQKLNYGSELTGLVAKLETLLPSARR